MLTTPRLLFRPWTETDLDLARGLWGDPRVTKFIGGPFSDEQIQARLANEIVTMSARGVQYWPVFQRSDGMHVGCCGLRPYGEDYETLELGFHLRFEYWGQGYGSESARAVIHHAFEQLGVGRLFAGHHPHNAESRRVLEKLGFRYTREEFHAPTGLMHPSYELTRVDHLRSAVIPELSPPPAALTLCAAHVGTLRTLLARLESMPHPWALTGSLSQRLQGIPVDVRDIDIRTDEAGAYDIGKRLETFTISPVAWRAQERIRSHFGLFEIAGVPVEVMGAMEQRAPSGRWEPALDVAVVRAQARFEAQGVPVVPLAHDIRMYELLGRLDRVTLLTRHLARNS